MDINKALTFYIYTLEILTVFHEETHQEQELETVKAILALARFTQTMYKLKFLNERELEEFWKVVVDEGI